ncbi:hypothetical protein [Streptomyces carpinensis]|uniref:Uncharacterized protein n=1 Tax=Streptomyces carpinensis TaxID=66369 RepID=A0ABV1VY65_9ACTN|nr:hypothetical protein [Streptomyces carpinensis]
MREKPDNGGEQSAGEEVRKKKRIDLSVPQVAGSAVAAVVAAKLASYFGVYGTILGAGLVSVVATCGGSVFQHFFRRTGEQLREAAVATRPVPASVPSSPMPPPMGEFTPGTVYRARVKSWKRPVVAAALVFGVTMAGITAYELVSGNSFSGGNGTTVGDAVSGRRAPSLPSGPTGGETPVPSGSRTPSAGTGDGMSQRGTDSGRTDSGTTVSPTPTPDGTGRTGTGGQSTGGVEAGTTTGTDAPAPEPTASATTPAPSASSRSGTGVPDPAGPAGP